MLPAICGTEKSQAAGYLLLAVGCQLHYVGTSVLGFEL